MSFFGIFRKEKKEKNRKFSDFYQDSIDKLGRDQFKKLVDKGLSIPVIML